MQLLHWGLDKSYHAAIALRFRQFQPAIALRIRQFQPAIALRILNLGINELPKSYMF